MRLHDIGWLGALLIRDGEFTSVGFIEDNRPNQLVYAESAEYLESLRHNVTCVVTTPNLFRDVRRGDVGIVATVSPRKVFYAIHNQLVRTGFYHLEGDSTGKDCEISPHATILPNTIIGDEVVIRAGVVIGTEGFKFERSNKEIIRVLHGGGVRIGDRVELQANCCVSKSLFGGYTEIGDDTKFDNLVHVAHGVKIGKRCFIAANTMIAGNAIIGDDVTIGPSVAIGAFGVRIGDKANITIGSVVTKDVLPGQRVTGNFAIEHSKFIKFLKGIR